MIRQYAVMLALFPLWERGLDFAAPEFLVHLLYNGTLPNKTHCKTKNEINADLRNP